MLPVAVVAPAAPLRLAEYPAARGSPGPPRTGVSDSLAREIFEGYYEYDGYFFCQ